MQATRGSVQPARPRQKSCAECRRRKQKCNPRKDGPCGNCSRRYPPVDCQMPDATDRNVMVRPKHEAEVQLSHRQKFIPPIINERPYVSPYPAIQERSIVDKVQDSSQQKIHSQTASATSSTNSSSIPSPDNILDSDIDIPPIPAPDQRRDVWLRSQSNLMLDERKYAYGSPRAFGGALASVNTLNGLPIKPTLRNAELFHFFHQFVVPNLMSLDGGDSPAPFLNEILPWMIQSPLMPNIAILMASSSQAVEMRVEASGHSETLAIKAHVLSLINQFLKQDFNVVGGEALRSVIHLVILEWFWGSQPSLWAHMKGLKQMVKLRGGFQGMKDPLLEQVMIITDYELACCFERDLYLQDQASTKDDLPVSASYPESFGSPLLAFRNTFQNDRDSLKLTLATAEILDDIRFLTTSMTSGISSTTSSSKIQSTAAWLHQKISALPKTDITPITTESDLIFDTVRSAALVYCSCIMSLTPFTGSFDEAHLDLLYSSLSAVSLTRWKEIPGIFSWVLLVVCPSTGNSPRDRFLKRKMAVAAMTIGLKDPNVATAQLRSFWKVQRWIAREDQRIENPTY